ncbi:MAG: carbon storage regulator CsrA [Firmicutes bacterium]|nr:carbon storage regulator CsrA [Bacillota bacterium]
MLVISRKKGEAINIGHNIKVVVVNYNKDTVKVGIDAPKDIDIYRAEIYQEIQRENLKSMTKQDILKAVKEGYTFKEKDKKK